MEQQRNPCQGMTKAGKPCKNLAQVGSQFCHVHGEANQSAQPAAPQTADFEQMADRLNDLAVEIQVEEPGFAPPPFSLSELVQLLRENLAYFTPTIQSEILRELQNNLKDASPRDALDPEVWKGMWYVLNYLAQSESQKVMEKVGPRLMAIPGFSTLADLRRNLDGASPRDLLDLDTWKGMWIVLNGAVDYHKQEAKRRIFGQKEE